jgi:hypothetical protein
MVQIIRDGFLVPLNERPSLGRSKLVQRISSSSWFRGIGGSGGGLSGLSEGGLGGLGFIQRYRQCRRLSQWSLGGLGGLGGLRGCSSCSRVQVLEVRAEVLGAHRQLGGLGGLGGLRGYRFGGSRGSLQSSGPQVHALQVRFSDIGSSTGSISESLQALSAVQAVSASRRSWVLRVSVLVVSWRPRSWWSSGSQGHFMLVVWCPRDSAVFSGLGVVSVRVVSRSRWGMVRCVSRWSRGGLGGVGCLGFFSRTFHVVVGLEASGGLGGVKAVFRRSLVLGAVVSVLMVSRSALEQGAVRPGVFTPAGRTGAVGVSWWSRGGPRGIRRGSGSSHGHSMVWRPPGCFSGASAESEISGPQGESMQVSEVSVVSGLFQCCWSRVQCWVWCDENLSACAAARRRVAVGVARFGGPSKQHASKIQYINSQSMGHMVRASGYRIRGSRGTICYHWFA